DDLELRYAKPGDKTNWKRRPAQQMPIACVRGCCVDSDQHVAVTECRHRNLSKVQHVGRSVRLSDDGFHSVAPSCPLPMVGCNGGGTPIPDGVPLMLVTTTAPNGVRSSHGRVLTAVCSCRGYRSCRLSRTGTEGPPEALEAGIHRCTGC